MKEPFFEKQCHGCHCDSCGAVNSSTRYKHCDACWSPAPIVRERRSVSRRTVLIGGLIGSAALLGGGGVWAASSLFSRGSHPQPGQPLWEILLDPQSDLAGSGPAALALTWSPDGNHIACSAMVGKPATKGVIVVDVKSTQIKWTHQEASFRFDAIAWSPDGARLALVGNSSAPFPYRSSFLQIWQVQGWQKVAQYPVSINDKQRYRVSGQLVWSPDGTHLAGGNNASSVQMWNASDGKVLFHWEVPSSDDNLYLSWLPDGHALAANYQEGGFSIWETRTGLSLFSHASETPWGPMNEERPFPQFLSGSSAALSPNGQRAALYTRKQGQLMTQVWDLKTASPLFSCQSVSGQHWNLTWSPDGKYIAECQSNGSPPSLRFWNAESGKLALSYQVPSLVGHLTWSPNGRFLAFAAHEGPSFKIPRNIWLKILAVE